MSPLVLLHSVGLVLGMALFPYVLLYGVTRAGIAVHRPRVLPLFPWGMAGITFVMLLAFSAWEAPIWQNFLLHMVGGGVATGGAYFWLMRQVVARVPAWAAWLGLFFFVSAFGVANELAEYAVHGLGVPMSQGVTDTWRDLAANTLGAYGAYFLCTVVGVVTGGKR